MYFSNSAIKDDVLSHWEQLTEKAYPEDLLTELAESACPVYYSDIISDWQEMPNEFTDSWQEFTEATQETTIFTLMGWDLWNYYQDAYQKAFEEVSKEKEESN
jgi:hypothetical protein